MTNPAAASYVKRGVELAMAGNLHGAIQTLNTAVSYDPNSVEGLSALADLYQRVGASQLALAALQRLERLCEMTLEEYLVYSDVLLVLGHLEPALSMADAAIRKDPKHLGARLVHATLLQYLGEHEKAEEAIREVIRLDPLNPEPYFRFAQSHRFTEDDRPLVESMRTILKKAIAPLLELASLNLALGVALDQLGEYEEAMSCYDEGNRLFRTARAPSFDAIRQNQSVDRIIETFTPELFRDNLTLGSPSETALFVVGMPRSGTSLTEQILSSHSKVFGAGELPFWTQEGVKAFDLSLRVRPEAVRELQESYLALLESKSAAADRVVDKFPDNYRVLGIIHLCFPNARIIHCRRNPVDTCLSIYSYVFRGDPPFAHDKENIVSAYRLYGRLMAHWRRVLPSDRFFEIDYERLIQDQESATKELIEFCGLDWEDVCLQPEKNKRAVTTASQWQIRQPVYRTSVDKWRRFSPWLGAFQSLIDSPPEQ